MSTEDKMAALGRLATEHAKAKQEVTLHDAEIQRFADTLRTLSGVLTAPSNFSRARTLLLEHQIAKYFSVGALQKLMDDREDANHRLAELRRKMEGAGLL